MMEPIEVLWNFKGTLVWWEAEVTDISPGNESDESLDATIRYVKKRGFEAMDYVVRFDPPKGQVKRLQHVNPQIEAFSPWKFINEVVDKEFCKKYMNANAGPSKHVSDDLKVDGRDVEFKKGDETVLEGSKLESIIVEDNKAKNEVNQRASKRISSTFQSTENDMPMKKRSLMPISSNKDRSTALSADNDENDITPSTSGALNRSVTSPTNDTYVFIFPFTIT